MLLDNLSIDLDALNGCIDPQRRALHARGLVELVWDRVAQKNDPPDSKSQADRLLSERRLLLVRQPPDQQLSADEFDQVGSRSAVGRRCLCLKPDVGNLLSLRE